MQELPPIDSLAILTERPGQIYVSHDNTAYISGEENQVFQLTSKLDFKLMTGDEITAVFEREKLQQ